MSGIMKAFVHSFRVKHQIAKFTTKTAKGVDLVSPLIGLTEDQVNFYQVAKEFSDNEMKPFANEWDEKCLFPRNVLKKLADLGFAGIMVKNDVGGSGLSRADSTVIIEALATGCVGTTAMLTIHNMCAGMIDKYGTPHQRQLFLPSMCSFDIMASYCLTEPESGSDAASLSTKAVYDDKTDEYVITGNKVFISGAGVSDLYVVMCRTTAADNNNVIHTSSHSTEQPINNSSTRSSRTKSSSGSGSGISCFLVPKNTPGLSFGCDESKMGWKVQPTRQVMFDDVRVSAKNHLLGNLGHGFKMAMNGLDGGRLSIAACSLGAAQTCFELALHYTKERHQFQSSLASNQAIQFKLADMAGKIVSSRALLRQAAILLDTHHPAASVHCAVAKKIVTDYGFEVCNEALQLHGGYGYLKAYQVERYVRDVRVHQILEGTNEIMRHIVGKALIS